MLILCLEYLSLCAAVSILQPDFKNVSTNVDERVVLDVKDVSLAMPVAPHQGPGVGQGAEVYRMKFNVMLMYIDTERNLPS